MKRLIVFLLLFAFNLPVGKTAQPDTVSVGIYVNSIHDIDFKEKQYTINLWLWLKYKNRDFDFSKYLEVPNAKIVDKSFYTVDTLDDGRIYMMMKLNCIMKDSWKIQHFPFDRQKLRFTIENSQYDSGDLLFAEDTAGAHYSKWTSVGWHVIDGSFKIKTGIKKYETAFGDPSLNIPHSEFSVFKVNVCIERDSWWLFLKLFIGMYVSFLLSFVCFFIHHNNIDSRISLSVGALFAVIGNKYVVDSALPESTSFTLVDTLHGITLFFIFISVSTSIYISRLIKNNKMKLTSRFDHIAPWAMLGAYLLLNIWFVYRACYSPPM